MYKATDNLKDKYDESAMRFQDYNLITTVNIKNAKHLNKEKITITE